MEAIFGGSSGTLTIIFLINTLSRASSFEFENRSHKTANAAATVV